MKLYIALGIGISACGGAPFELMTNDAAPDDAAAPVPAPSSDAARLPPHDAMSPTDDAAKMSPDADMPQEAAVIDAAGDGRQTCTAFPIDENCAGYAIPKYVLDTLCDVVANTPPECQCRETYNCSCFLRHVAAICGRGTLGCIEGNPPAARCNP